MADKAASVVAVKESDPGRGCSKTGDLISACTIDLPENDVIEAIEFERFFMLNLRLDEFERPATLVELRTAALDLGQARLSYQLLCEEVVGVLRLLGV